MRTMLLDAMKEGRWQCLYYHWNLTYTKKTTNDINEEENDDDDEGGNNLSINSVDDVGSSNSFVMVVMVAVVE